MNSSYQSTVPMNDDCGISITTNSIITENLLGECTTDNKESTTTTSDSLDIIKRSKVLCNILHDLKDNHIQNTNNNPYILVHREGYRKRLLTFNVTTYFGKPIQLSPVICALLGWSNVANDTLKCHSCQAQFVVLLPDGLVPAAVTHQLIGKYEKQLYCNAHQKYCIFDKLSRDYYDCYVRSNDSNETSQPQLDEEKRQSIYFKPTTTCTNHKSAHPRLSSELSHSLNSIRRNDSLDRSCVKNQNDEPVFFIPTLMKQVLPDKTLELFEAIRPIDAFYEQFFDIMETYVQTSLFTSLESTKSDCMNLNINVDSSNGACSSSTVGDKSITPTDTDITKHSHLSTTDLHNNPNYGLLWQDAHLRAENNVLIPSEILTYYFSLNTMGTLGRVEESDEQQQQQQSQDAGCLKHSYNKFDAFQHITDEGKLKNIDTTCNLVRELLTNLASPFLMKRVLNKSNESNKQNPTHKEDNVCRWNSSMALNDDVQNDFVKIHFAAAVSLLLVCGWAMQQNSDIKTNTTRKCTGTSANNHNFDENYFECPFCGARRSLPELFPNLFNRSQTSAVNAVSSYSNSSFKTNNIFGPMASHVLCAHKYYCPILIGIKRNNSQSNFVSKPLWNILLNRFLQSTSRSSLSSTKQHQTLQQQQQHEERKRERVDFHNKEQDKLRYIDADGRLTQTIIDHVAHPDTFTVQESTTKKRRSDNITTTIEIHNENELSTKEDYETRLQKARLAWIPIHKLLHSALSKKQLSTTG